MADFFSKFLEILMPSVPYLAKMSGCDNNSDIFEEISWQSQSAILPLSPSIITSGTIPTLVATTGTPQAIDSNTTLGPPSLYDVIIKTLDLFINSVTSRESLAQPYSTTLSPNFKFLIFNFRLCHSGPVPTISNLIF